ncbi:hypothetical protein [Dielma fastidiosa]|uniref:hypothetical protein n=1 Tax=Dielma fastidiosa TaxID=1034346 RepID=UPI000E4B9B15|nr:hypothetical protein [Dielma fastidiosa]RHN00856.1 hypothetical protein DWZ33_08475 [Dielma fastidiosa]
MENTKIEYLVKKKGKSRRNASIEMNIPLSTLNHILDKDIKSTTGKNLLILSKYLNLSVDDLLKENDEINKKIKVNEINNLLNTFNDEQLNSIKTMIEAIIKIKEN